MVPIVAISRNKFLTVALLIVSIAHTFFQFFISIGQLVLF